MIRFQSILANIWSLFPGLKLALYQRIKKMGSRQISFKIFQVLNQMSIIFKAVSVSVFPLKILWSAENKSKWNGGIDLVEQNWAGKDTVDMSG